MTVRDWFVVSVAIGIGCIALTSAFRIPILGLEQRVYQLRSIRSVEDRWGERAARGLLFLIAGLMFAMGYAIVGTATHGLVAKPSLEDPSSP